MTLSLTTTEGPGAPIVALAGELDLATVPELNQRLEDLITAGARQIVLDLAGLTFLDSTGIGALVGAARRLGAESGLLLARPQGPVSKVLSLSGLDEILSVHGSLEEAQVLVV